MPFFAKDLGKAYCKKKKNDWWLSVAHGGSQWLTVAQTAKPHRLSRDHVLYVDTHVTWYVDTPRHTKSHGSVQQLSAHLRFTLHRRRARDLNGFTHTSVKEHSNFIL